ncbi:MAG: hypothetical protein J6B85_03380 [Lachnospiraceae bacterium]|nr:hypothetical protein [Lachnospiraceae bacterium]
MAKKASDNIRKLKKRKDLNIGLIIFLFVFIYIAINIGIYLTKDQLSIYEVQADKLAQNNMAVAVILREEEVVTTQRAGYINYYLRSSERVAKNRAVYSIDENRDIYEKLTADSGSVSLTDEDIVSIQSEIFSFQRNFSTMDYQRVYDTKYDIMNQIQERLDANLLENLEELQDSTGLPSSFQVVHSDQSGIVSYYMDGLEGLTAEAVTGALFESEEYAKTSLRTSDIKEAGSPVYKIVTNDNWQLIIRLDEEQYAYFKEKGTITFTILKDERKLTKAAELYQSGADYFASVSMDRYMIQYIDERFLQVELAINAEEGLKIPQTAITEKEFYMVPLKYFTKGGDSDADGILVETYDEESAQMIPVFREVEIYYDDGTYGYIDSDEFEFGKTRISAPDGEQMQLNLVGKLEGVYNVNKGYAVFRRIERMYENEDYCIVRKDTSNGLAVYDQIVLDAAVAVEQAIIY